MHPEDHLKKIQDSSSKHTPGGSCGDSWMCLLLHRPKIKSRPWWMDKVSVLYIHNGVVFDHRAERHYITRRKRGETGEYHIKWSKPDSHQGCMLSLMSWASIKGKILTTSKYWGDYLRAGMGLKRRKRPEGERVVCRIRWTYVRRCSYVTWTYVRRELLEGRGDQLEQEGDKKGKGGWWWLKKNYIHVWNLIIKPGICILTKKVIITMC